MKNPTLTIDQFHTHNSISAWGEEHILRAQSKNLKGFQPKQDFIISDLNPLEELTFHWSSTERNKGKDIAWRYYARLKTGEKIIAVITINQGC